MLRIPFEPFVFGYSINVHLILEYVAFFVAFRYYVFLRKRSVDPIPMTNRMSIILGAAIGALIGSRVIGFLENPTANISAASVIEIFNTKTIMGGLFGGLLGVEIAKKIILEKKLSSGDLFTLPICVGIFIGRIGCFLNGTNEFTYGKVTTSFDGMDLGDGMMRHPIVLYELLFLAALFFFLRYCRNHVKMENGELFKIFMIAYFGFRFCIEFLKPNVFFIIGLSSIQWLCLICLVYYRNTIIRIFSYAH